MLTSLAPIIQKVTNALTIIGKYLPLFALLLVLGITLIIVIRLLLCVFVWRQLLRQKYVFLEITPPMAANMTPNDTKGFYKQLHGLAPTLREMAVSSKLTLSLEVPASHDRGIRYMLRVPEYMATTVQDAITSYLPSSRIAVAEDYLPSSNPETRVMEFKQRQPWPFPLKKHELTAEHDPFDYLAGIMAGLAPDEHVALQVVITPVVIRDTKLIVDKLLRNEDLIGHLSTGRSTVHVQRAFGAINFIFSSTMSLLTSLFHDNTQNGLLMADQERREKRDIAMRRKPARSIGSLEQELHDSLHDKADQSQFRTDIRVLVVMDKKRAKQRSKALKAMFASFDTSYQELRARYNFPVRLKGRYRLFMFKNRLPSLLPRHSNILATSELADIYHFPTASTPTNSLVQSMSRTLPATLALKRGTDIDVVIGRNRYQGKLTDIGLTVPERARHVYVIGSTGSGKTTMMKYAIMQDIASGKGFAVIEPHGDMALELLQYIPEERRKDVIYFDPSDLEYSIGLNMLEIDPSLTGDDLLRAQYLIVEYTVEIFRKLFSDDDSGGSRIEAVMRNAIYTAFTTKDPTLFTVYRLITEKAFRKEVVDKLDDEVLKSFWNNEFDQGGEYQRVKMGFGVTHKVGRFLTAVFVRRVIEQPKSTIDFDDIINNGKILICNFSKGTLVKDTSTLFGTAVLARLQIAAQRRGSMREDERRPFYIYVDEFQNFATTTFVDMLAEARKYKVHLFMAEQTTSQQDQEVVHNILANVGTVVCFGTGNPMDEQLLLPRFEPWIGRGEIANLPSYNFFARIRPVGQSDSQAPVSGETIKLEEVYDEAKEKLVIDASRANYAKKYVPVARVEAPEKAKAPKSTNIINPTTETR